MPRVATRSTELRAKILDAAVSLLREKGAKGLSQPRVARRAGIPQGHLTYYFPRKRDLLAAVARRFHEQVQRELVALSLLRGGPGAHAASAELLTRLVLDVQRSRTLLGLLVESEGDRGLRRSLRELVADGRPALARLLGVEPRGPDVDLVLALSWGLQVEQLLLGRSRGEVRSLVDRVLSWLAAVRARDAVRSEKKNETKGRKRS